ncbi:MAG: dienelactone hydrolase family protein [Acidimicrobiales bacterium]
MRITLPSGTPAEIHRVANPRMGLVICPDIWGLRPLFDDLVRDLAERWQMSVVAVEPFPGLDLPEGDMAPRAAAIPALRDDDNLRDLEQAADELGTAVTGVMGFCLGGMYCFKAARSDRFARFVPFYGMITIPEGWRSVTQGEPLGHLISGNAESVLAILGGHDPYTPLADIDQLRSTGAVCVVYPEAEHGFAHDASRASHRADDAADAFRRAEEWLLDALG